MSGTTQNPVAEGLNKAHVAPLEDLRALDTAVRLYSREDLVGLRDRLEATRAHITEHFRFEEQNGYMDAVRNQVPRLERTIEQLAEEHSQLSQSLDAIIGEARAATSLGDSLREQIQGWVERVRQHEIRENDFIQDAFNLDIGAED